MRVLIATGKKDLDEFVRQLVQSPFPPVTYKEGVISLCGRNKPDIVVLSAFLDGNVKTKDVLYQLRKNGARVIMLIGHTEPNEIRNEWIPLGVYDYITDPVTEEKIRFALEYPATLGMAEERLQMLESGGKEEFEIKQEKGKSLFKNRKQAEIKREKRQKGDGVVEKVWHPFTFQQTGQPLEWGASTETIPKKVGSQDPKPEQWTFDQPETSTTSVSNDPIIMDRKPDQPQNDGHKEPKAENQSLKDTHKKMDNGLIETKGKKERGKRVVDNTLPDSGYNIVVLSPAPVGKTYVAMNLATVLSKRGINTELVAFEGSEDLWQYFDLPMMEQSTPKGLPNLLISPYKKMNHNAKYRVIDLPYDRWAQAKKWDSALFLYVSDMDIVHRRQAERRIEEWQGRKVLRVLNRFLSNVLDSGQEQKIRMEADIVLDDRPSHYLAMRFGRSVSMTDQSAAREFEMAVKAVQEALPQSGQNNLFAINQTS